MTDRLEEIRERTQRYIYTAPAMLNRPDVYPDLWFLLAEVEKLGRIADAAWAVWSEGQCSPRDDEELERFHALADAFKPYAEAREAERIAAHKEERM